MEPQAQDPLNSILAEFSTRLNDIEERQRLIKDRILLIGENLIATKEDLLKVESEFKINLKKIAYEITSLKQLMHRVVIEMPNLAKKSELEILERQFKMFDPLEFARMKDIRDIVKEELRKQAKNKGTK